MDDKPPAVTLGCMYWAKVDTYPWWPCMLYNSPTGDGYVKKLKTTTKYHVQFFGPDVERAWVAEANLIPYKSKFELDSQLEEIRKAYPLQTPKYELKVSNAHKHRWEESCKEAETAYRLTLEERIRRFGRIITTPKSSLGPELRTILLKNVDRIPLTIEEEAESLELFLKTEKARRLALNPVINEAELDKTLRVQWSGFDFATQRSYLSNKLAIFGLESTVDIDEEMKVPPTGRRPSISGSVASSAKKSVSSGESRSERTRGLIDESGSKVDAEILRLIASPGPFRFQPVCSVCKETSNDRFVLISCKGVCARYWHPGCLPVSSASNKEIGNIDKFMCKDCRNKKYLCGVCGESKEDESTTQMLSCQMQDCGKWYHRHCLEFHPAVVLENKLVRCPSHICATCYLENPKATSIPGQNMIQCFSCPRVFHSGDLCTPAGSRELSLSHIVCPAHLKPAKRIPPAPFCLLCHDGGPDRVNCESCPTSYHRTCLSGMGSEQKVMKQNTFKCNNCCWGIQPRYAQVVWVKVHSCRWWPCEIIHSRNAPLNIYSLKHSDGEFVIHFIGSNEYGWVHQCQTLPFECALGSPLASDVPNAIAPLDKTFNKALREAPLVHQLYVSYLLRRGLILVSMTTQTLTDAELIPLSTLEAAAAVGILSQSETEARVLDEAMAKFENISSNIYASSEEEMLVKQPLPTTLCDCARLLEEQQPFPVPGGREEREALIQWRCSMDFACYNILQNIDCSPEVCSVMARHPSGNCGNRNFSDPPVVSLILTTNRGIGLKVMQPVSKHALVIEYMGEVVSTAEANRRLAMGIAACNAAAATTHNSELLPSTYLLRFTPNLVIDASRVGSEARFINHSCDPNAVTKVCNVGGTLRMGIFAKRDLENEEEVTIDYRKAQLLDCYFMNATNVCVCGSEICEGFVKLPHKFSVPEKKRTSVGPTAMALPTPLGSIVASSERSLRSGRRSEVVRKQEPMGPPPAPRHSLLTRSMPPPTSPPPMPEVGSPSRGHSKKTTIPHHLLSAAATEKPPPTKVSPRTPSPCTPKVVVTQRLTQPLHEEYCFRCGDGGEMILCSRASCPKVYHLGCLGLTAPPTGDWHCPWHFCDTCGNPAMHLCCRCPSSYCLDHSSSEDGKELIRVHDLDANRWHHTLKLLERCSSDPVEMTKMTAALIFRCRWVCHIHNQTKLHHLDPVSTLKESEVNIENSETCVVSGDVPESTGNDVGEDSAGVDEEGVNTDSITDNKTQLTDTPVNEISDKAGGGGGGGDEDEDDDGNEDRTSTVCEEGEGGKQELNSPCQLADEI